MQVKRQRGFGIILAAGMVLLAAALVEPHRQARGEDWPNWRGPRGDGTSHENDLPVSWNGETGDNIAWKTRLPGSGHASPIVVGDSIFVVACLEETKDRVLLHLDRRDGRIQWQRTVFGGPLESRHLQNSYASSTPASDGRLVYVTFLEVDGRTISAPNVSAPRPVTPGQMVVAAYDFDGNQQWVTRPGEFISVHGFCSSPVLYRNLVIVNGDHDGDSYFVALDKQSGDIVWKVPREYGLRSYATPIIRERAGRTEMVVSGSRRVVGMDPLDGSLIWHVEGPTEQFVASMVDDGERYYVAAGYPTRHVMSVRPGGEGDVTDSHVAWHVTNASCYVPSPVIVGPYLLVADDRGTANCFDTETGRRWWQGRLGSHFHASLVAADGLAYFVASDGLTRIVRPGRDLQIVAENPLGERCYASPAISQGNLFLRGTDHLFCIGPSPAETASQ